MFIYSPISKLDNSFVRCTSVGHSETFQRVDNHMLTGVQTFLLGIIYMLAGFPLSYFLWYRPLYRAMRY